MAWKKEKFKTLIEHKSGYTWSKEQETKFPEAKTVRVLTVTNVQKELDLSSELYLKDVSEADKVKKAVSKDWSIAVSSNGNRSRIGNAVYIKEDSEYLFASFLTAFKPKEESDILPDYFFRWLTSHNIQERITAVSEGTTGLGNLDIRFLRNMDIDYPENPAEQTAIATILSKVDEAIAATQNSIKAAEKLKKALMQNLLTGKLKPDGSWRTEDEFYETKIGRIPVDWTLVKTKDFCEKVTDGTHDTPKPNNTGFPLVTSKNLKVNGVDFNDCYLISEQDYNEINKRSKVEQYDILFGMIGTVGNPQIVMQNPVEFAIKNVGLFRMNGNQKLSLWLKNYLASDIFRVYQQRQQAGTTQQFVSLGFLRKIPVPIPMVNDEINYSLIDGINKKIEIADSELISKQTKIQTLQRLKKSLMQNLLTGKVRLPQEFIAQFEEVEETIKS